MARKKYITTLYVMYDDTDGECEFWFNKNKKCIGGYYLNDANWRDEYFGSIFAEAGINIKTLKNNPKMVKDAKAELF